MAPRFLRINNQASEASRKHVGNLKSLIISTFPHSQHLSNPVISTTRLNGNIIVFTILIQSTFIKLFVALVWFKAALLVSLLSPPVHSSDAHSVLLLTAIVPTSGSLDCRLSRETSESIACFQPWQPRRESSLALLAISLVLRVSSALQALTRMEMRLLSSAL